VAAFLRARAAPTTVQLLGKECPRPAGLGGKLIILLSSDERFQIDDLGGEAPMVHMRRLETLSPDPCVSQLIRKRGRRFREVLND